LDKLVNDAPCVAILLKRLVARLRRSSRPPELLREDWLYFKELFESKYEFWISFCSTRWLVSILTTYIDHADPLESRNAMIAILPASWEVMVQNRMSSTEEGWEFRKKRASELSPYSRRRWKVHPSIRNSRPAFWSGQQSFTSPGDMPIKLLRRVSTILRSTPIIYKVFKYIIAEMLRAPETTIGALTDLDYENFRRISRKYKANI